MEKADALEEARQAVRRVGADEIPVDCYHGVDLAPCTLEVLVTWDVSVHARREQERLTAAGRNPGATQGGY